MKVQKVILYSLLVAILIGALSLFKTRLDQENIIFTFVAAVAVWLMGIFVGFLLAAIIQRPAIEHWFYMSGHVLVVLGIVIFIVVMNYQIRQREEQFGNVNYNHSFVDYDGSRNAGLSSYVKTAFIKLESSFSNPNDFSLNSFYAGGTDTVINGYAFCVPAVYFVYTMKEDRIRFAKIGIWNDSARIHFMHADTTNAEYCSAGQTEAEITESLHKALQEAPDSLRKQLIDTLIKSLKE